MLIILAVIFFILIIIFRYFDKDVLFYVFFVLTIIDIAAYVIIILADKNETLISEDVYILSEQNLKSSEDESSSFYVVKRGDKYSFVYYDELVEDFVEDAVDEDDYHELDSCNPQVKVRHILSKPAFNYSYFLVFTEEEEYKEYEVFVPKGTTIELQ